MRALVVSPTISNWKPFFIKQKSDRKKSMAFDDLQKVFVLMSDWEEESYDYLCVQMKTLFMSQHLWEMVEDG